MNITAHQLAAGTEVPNHPHWPLLVYAGAMPSPTPEAFEALFTRNRWPAAWRNGVFPFHHYHSNAHEVLGVYQGEVTVLFGGEGGVMVTAKPGDVLILPAGTGHKRIAARGTLGVVGAYPEGADPDTCRGGAQRPDVEAAIMRVRLPGCDPVCGRGGPLFEYWNPSS